MSNIPIIGDITDAIGLTGSRSTPPAPTPAPAPVAAPTRSDAQQASGRSRAAAASRRGRGSTILTSRLGAATDPANLRRRTLGGA